MSRVATTYAAKSDAHTSTSSGLKRELKERNGFGEGEMKVTPSRCMAVEKEPTWDGRKKIDGD